MTTSSVPGTATAFNPYGAVGAGETVPAATPIVADDDVDALYASTSLADDYAQQAGATLPPHHQLAKSLGMEDDRARIKTLLDAAGGDEDAVRRAVAKAGGRGGLLLLASEVTREATRDAAQELRAAAPPVDLDAVGAVDDDDDAFWASLTAAAPTPTVHGLLYRTGLHMVAGAPGCGKTWLALDALRRMADSTYPALAPREDMRRPVVYVDADGNGRAALLRRLMQLGATPDDVRAGGGIRIVSLPDVAAAQSCSMEGALRAVVAAAEQQKCKALVLDTMARAIVAMGGDSNSSDSVTGVLNLLAPLAESACVMVLDHVGHEHKDRPSGSMAKIGAPSVVLMMDKMRRDSETYPDTVLGVAISVVKDRHGGIIAHTCDPEDERRAGVWALREEEGRTVERLGASRLTSDMIPARVSAEKREREAAEAEAAARPVADIIAEAVGEAGKALTKTAARAAILAARDDLTRRGAEDALDAAVEAGQVIAAPDPKRHDRTTYTAPQPSSEG